MSNSYLYPVGRSDMTIDRLVGVEKDIGSLKENVKTLVDRMDKTNGKLDKTTDKLNDTNIAIAELIGEMKVTNAGIIEQKKKGDDQEERLRLVEQFIAEGKTGRELASHVIKTVIAATAIAVCSAVISMFYSTM